MILVIGLHDIWNSQSQGNQVQYGGYPSLSGKANGESLINRDKLSV